MHTRTHARTTMVRKKKKVNAKKAVEFSNVVVVRLALRFAEATPHTVSVVAYAEFDNLLEIDRDRNLLVDFGVDDRCHHIIFLMQTQVCI